MKYFLILFSLFFNVYTFAQIDEQFADGDFTNNPVWNGSNTAFLINDGKLRSNSSIASSSFYLRTPSSLSTKTVWEFYLNLQFNTSSANYVDAYLIADNANLQAVSNAFFIRIGDTNDDISFYRKISGINIKLMDGLDGKTNKSDNTLKIRVTRNTAGNLWVVETDVTGTGNNYVVEGTAMDAAVINNQGFGFFVQQSTASFFNKHFFDDISVSTDNIAPVLTKIEVISATKIDLTFSESLDLPSVQNVLNYTVNQSIGNPVTALRDVANPRLVHLTLGANLLDLQTYTLQYGGMKDICDNVTSVLSMDFTYMIPSIANARDIVINELMADPTNTNGVVGLPDAEYVELYNTSNRPINIGGWTLEGSGSSALPSFVLNANSYVLLCNATDVLKFSGNVLSWGSGTLTNTGEELILKDNTGRIIDQFAYNDGMYVESSKNDGGWSLEQINPKSPCASAANWRASTNASGGTPNALNSVFSNNPDTAPPILQNAAILSPTRLLLSFNEVMESGSLGNLSNYSIDNGIGITSLVLSANLNSVELNLTSPIQQGIIYAVTVINVKDCSGNHIGTQNTAKAGIGFQPKFNELIITEIFADENPKVGLPEYEFIEIYNPTSRIIDLEGCKLNEGSDKIFTKNVIYPKEYVTICALAYVKYFEPFGRVIGISSLSLLNGGELLVLKNKSNTIVSAVNYSDSWYRNSTKKEGGWSLEMVDVDNPCGEADNWVASTNINGGTPSKINSVNAAKPDLTKPFLKRVIARSPDTIQVFFNEKMDSLSLKKAGYEISPAQTIQNILVDSPEFKSVQLKISPNLKVGINYGIQVKYASDCSGNLIDDEKDKQIFGLPESADTMDLAINEILFNPRTGGSDFVELYNNSNKYINLKDWKLANANSAGNIDARNKITTTPYVVSPKSFLVLTENASNIQTEYPQSVADNFFEMPSIPSYNDDKGSVILINPEGKVMQRFDYSEKYHFALIEDEEGVSLERIDPASFTNMVSNWHSAATRVGYATPGYLNSQYKNEIQVDRQFQIDPKVFTPDEDGVKDFTTIHYELEKSGYVASILVFDKEGREVKKIANNELLAIKGFYTWDGTNYEGQKVGIGYYLVYIQLFDLNGNQKQLKQTVVVGSRF